MKGNQLIQQTLIGTKTRQGERKDLAKGAKKEPRGRNTSPNSIGAMNALIAPMTLLKILNEINHVIGEVLDEEVVGQEVFD